MQILGMLKKKEIILSESEANMPLSQSANMKASLMTSLKLYTVATP